MELKSDSVQAFTKSAEEAIMKPQLPESDGPIMMFQLNLIRLASAVERPKQQEFPATDQLLELMDRSSC